MVCLKDINTDRKIGIIFLMTSGARFSGYGNLQACLVTWLSCLTEMHVQSSRQKAFSAWDLATFKVLTVNTSWSKTPAT